MTITPWNGQQITEPGIYSGVPINEYHGNKDLFPEHCVSTSGVRAAGAEDGSPLDYWNYSIYNPDALEFERSRVMELGSATHLLVLGDEPFRNHFIEIPDDVLSNSGSRAGKAWKEWLAALNGELNPLTKTEMETVRKAAEAITACPEAHAVLDGLIEHTIVWRDKPTGLLLRARPDNLPLSGVVGDLKCTEAEITTRSAARRTEEGGYHAQLAMIGEGIRAVTGDAPTHYGLVYAGLKEPHHVFPVELDETWIEDGKHIMRRGIDRIAKGFETGEWPGRAHTASPTGIVVLNAPAYMAARVERERANA